MPRDDATDHLRPDVSPRRFEPGTVIAGKYRVERVIGQGGMGVVLAARHLGLDEMVAVKLIREEHAEGAEAIARFQREARAAARIKSEHVARVLDVDRLPEGEPYIVMELIDGTDLHALVRRRGPLPPDEAATYLLQACEGLAEAHALGMVHRDLKLKNLFLTKRRDGRPLIKVIDFGVVKLTLASNDSESSITQDSAARSRTRGAAAHEATLTGAAMLIGSVHYMAPEQIRASNVVDARADVWSLGVCLYSLLTAALPFDGDSVVAICSAIQGRPAPDVRALAPAVPAGLAQAVGRALEKDVRRRFSSVAELAHALQPFGADDAAASRIETILHSSSPGPSAPPPPVAFRGDADRTQTMAHDGGAAGARARVESTIDAAAVGLRMSAAPPAPPARRGRLRLGAGILVVAAGATLAIGLRARSPTPAFVAATSEPTAPPEAATTGPAPPAETPPAASQAPAPPPASAASSAGGAATGRAPARRPAGRAGKPAPAPAPAPPPTPTRSTAPAPPKPEATSAYDHF